MVGQRVSSILATWHLDYIEVAHCYSLLEPQPHRQMFNGSCPFAEKDAATVQSDEVDECVQVGCQAVDAVAVHSDDADECKEVGCPAIAEMDAVAFQPDEVNEYAKGGFQAVE